MSNFTDVKKFMETFGQIVRTKPQFPDEKTMQLRHDLIKEELDELGQIANEKNKVSFLDVRRQSLKTIDDIESLLITKNFPYQILGSKPSGQDRDM